MGQLALCVPALLLLAAVGVAQAPRVLWASDPVGPDETVLLIGEGLAADCRVEVARLADGAAPPDDAPLSLPPGATTSEGLQPSGQSLKFVLPQALQPGVFAYRVVGAGGASEPQLLNQAAAWWAQGDQGTSASPGGWLRVQGKCLRIEGGAPRLLLTGRRTVELPAEGDAYSVRAGLPQDLPEGTYQVRAHNGFGGPWGWSDPLPVQVEVAPPWPATRLDVRELGAAGDGLQDDTRAVQRGLERLAAEGGGTLYFPRGRYLVTETLRIPEHAALKGESRELSMIVWPDRAEPWPDMLIATHDFALEDLTFGLSNYGNFLSADLGTEAAGNVRLRRLRVLGNRYRGHMYNEPDEMSLRFTRFGVHGGKLLSLGGRNVEITDCDFLSSSCCLYLTRARGALIQGNRFRLGRFGWYWLSGSDGVILEDNELLGADLSTWGGGINNLDGSACSQNVYFARNRLAFYYGGDHEAITTDGSGSPYCGKVAGVSAARLTLAGEPQWEGRDWHGAGVFVLDGKGMCQYRAVTRYEGREIEVDRPWDIEPDGSSVLSISSQQRRLLLIGNDFEEVGVAIQFYGTSIECIAEGNRCRRGLGYINHGMNYHGNQPSWFTQWLGNEIAEGNSYGNAYFPDAASALDVRALPPGDGLTCPLTVGTIARRNRLLNNATISLGAGNPPNLAARCPWLRDVVAEGNLVTNSDLGIAVAADAQGVWLRANRYENVQCPEADVAELRREALARRDALAGSREPIAYWAFDTAAGGEVSDASGQGLDAAPVGGFSLSAEGVQGSAGQFDGSGYLTVGGEGRLVQDVLNQPEFTLALWVRPADVTGRRPLIGKRFAETSPPFILSITDGALTFEAADAEQRYSYNFASAPVVTVGEWQHLAVVVSGSESVSLWRNGEQVAEKSVELPVCENSEPLVFGRDPWAGPNVDRGKPSFYVGLMDEARFWARALSPDEVQQDYVAAGPR
jgi:hypothetical protein